MISCKDLMSLNIFKYIKLIAGESGLYKNVTWTYICETLDFRKWVNGGELVFITGIGMSLDEKDLNKLILECSNQDISGLVILTNSEYIKEIPISCIELSNELNLPLFNMSWDIKLIDVTREISNYIVEKNLIENKEKELIKELIFSYEMDEERIYKLCRNCKFNTNKLYLVAIFNVNDIKADKNYLDYIKLQLNKNDIKFLIDIVENKIICILNYKINEAINVKQTLKDINNNINEYQISTLSIGRSYYNVFDIKYSYEEAENAFDYYSYKETNIKNIDYDSIGFYKLLFGIKDIDKLKKYKNETIGKLLYYDEIKNTSLTKTLKVYLYGDGNLVNTAKKLFIHRNTLIYRIDKISKILNIDLDNNLTKSELINAIMINDYINYLENK
jgi:PucR family transcriptional regulator, proline-responsive transcriptional activator